MDNPGGSFNEQRYGKTGADAHSLHPLGKMTGKRDVGKILSIAALAGSIVAALAGIFLFGLYRLILLATELYP